MSGTRRNFNFFSRGDGAAFGLTRLAHPFARQKGQKNFLKRKVGWDVVEAGGWRFWGYRRLFLSGSEDAVRRGSAVDIRARHREARYNAPRAHFISYCRELRHCGTWRTRTCGASGGESLMAANENWTAMSTSDETRPWEARRGTRDRLRSGFRGSSMIKTYDD